MTDPTHVELAGFFEDVAEALRHLSARVAWSPGPARADFEERVGRIQAIATAVRAELAEESSADPSAPVDGAGEATGTMQGDSGSPPSA